MNIRHSKNVIQKVVSKYFTTEPVMDESSVFQEKKECRLMRKQTLGKKKKPAQRIKGQKDIRAALKARKNELLLYSEEFDKVCRKSGIDVDSEQLQIAIALSKSLNNTDSATSSTENNSSRGKTEKIRTTLLEYGFKVPKTKIEKNNRRPKKHRKPYKLLTTSDLEKKQILTDRYSQVLFDNYDNKTVDTTVTDFDGQSLQYLATNVPYNFLRENKNFYVKDLIQSSNNSVGSLLCDWSLIPGRPVSPVIKSMPRFEIAESNCKQEEIDRILSGTIKTAQNIIQNFTTKDLLIDSEVNLPSPSKSNNQKMSVEEINNLSDPQERSYSPDIFDDEVSLLFDKSNQNIDRTIDETPITNTQYQNSMDLTECVPTGKNFVNTVTALQDSNATKRKSNDYMEITECIASCSQSINNIKENDTPGQINVIDNIDLTQDCSVIEVDTEVKNKQEKIDLTQSSDSCDLPDVSWGSSKKSFKEETSIVGQNKYCETHSQTAYVSIGSENEADNELGPTDVTTVYSNAGEILDLTLEIDKSILTESTSTHKSNRSLITDRNSNNNEIDLTHTLELSHEDLHFASNSKSMKVSYGSLGKQDNISVDYDEILYIDNEAVLPNNDEHNMLLNDENCFSPNSSGTVSKSYERCSEPINNESVPTQDLEVFEISDNELDYSIQQSRLEVPKDHFALGGLSILDNDTKNSNILEDNCFRISEDNVSLRVGMLPENEEKNYDNESLDAKHQATPSKDCNYVVSTPKTDYIIKTEQVTPMMDYATMTTPDRNKELEKYGLKPFKRKRAIQLLTHLYKQTHPLIEEVNKEDLPSPAKKGKTETESNFKQCLPRKISKSPKKSTEIIERKISYKEERGKENVGENIYSVTESVPDLRDLPCNPENWMFQKKEKTKIHGCRLPLHIAFHNYLFCRRGLREAILRYEPVNIDVIHKDLVAMGYKYDPKDLLRFLDKKCITVKTAEHNSRNNKK